MNIHIFFICVLLISVSEYKVAFSRSVYDNPTYSSDRDENLPVLSSHQKKSLVNEYIQSIREDPNAENYDRAGALYENHYKKYQPDTYARPDSRMERQGARDDFEEKINPQKREFYDSPGSPKDASIEVILDPKAKKAVAVLENSPNGQEMYDLTGWKNKDGSPSYESDQYSPSNQEQVVNLVYPAERAERKYSQDVFEQNPEYSEKVTKGGFKEKVMENERVAEDSHKRKRNADVNNKSENEKRSTSENKLKKKSDQSKNPDTKTSNECPPHNVQLSTGVNDNKNANNNEKYEKQKTTVKRDIPQFSQDQIDALKTSLARVRDNSGEVQNLKNILSNMGLIDSSPTKREAKKSLLNDKVEENKEQSSADIQGETEDEDLSQDNVVLKRNDREISNENIEEDLNNAPQEPMEKREADESENYEEEEENEEAFDAQDEKKEVKRSNEETVEKAIVKEEVINKDDSQNRKKRANTESTLKAGDSNAKNNNSPTECEASANIEDIKKYTKRDTSAKDMRKNRDDKEIDEEYEKRMENQIQAKIDAIKEKVKREILEEQLQKRYTRNSNTETEALKLRKRRQIKDDTTKVVKDSDNATNKVVASSNPSEAQNKIVRKKRANNLPEKQMVYKGYQTDQDEDGEENSEFDDNVFDGRMYLEKRQADEENDYFDPVRKREVENYLRQYYPDARNQRSFGDRYTEDSNAFHGNPMSSNRRALKSKSYNELENQQEYNTKFNENNNSDNEYFGSLPQSYNGELTRYKRVKRDNPYK